MPSAWQTWRRTFQRSSPGVELADRVDRVGFIGALVVAVAQDAGEPERDPAGIAGRTLDAVEVEWWSLNDKGEPVWRVDPKAWEAVARRFDSLTLDNKRRLIQSLVTITVNPGQGKRRVDIEPIESPTAASAWSD